jgi:hypothetical protein
MKRSFIYSTIIIFVLLSVIFYALKIYAPEYHFAGLESGNLIMALLSLVTYYLVNNQSSSRPQAFVRGVYSASFLKLMVCMISILVYLLLNRPNIHKPSVFVLFGIYAVYTIVETWLLSRTVRE